MINQSSVEALYSGAFVENYFDCVENLPDDVQRYMTRMRELDVTYRAYLRDVETHLDMCIASPKDEQGQGKAYSKAYLRVQKSLIAAQELGDEKLQIMQVLQDVIDNKSRQLNLDHRKLEFNTNGNIKEEPVPPSPPAVKEPIPPPLVTNNNTLVPHQHTATNNNAAATPPHIQEKEKEKSDRDNKNSGERASKRPRRTRNDTQSGADSGGADPGPSHTTTNTNTTTQKKGMGKKKKRKGRQSAAQSQREDTPPPEEPDPIDPDEPTYCLCDQISFGEMILCDNDLCPIEWFHFSCVSLTTKPKGKWFCPKCRGDRPNVMKPKVQFLKELEQYNKLKEDKA